jgi:hypothetical protein
MTIIHLVKLNGEEITEHGRTFSGGSTIKASDVELNNGTRRRYIKNSKDTYSLSFRYLPSLQNKTIDGRKGRDYLYQIARTPSSISLSIKLDPEEGFYNTTAYVESYNETLIRRDIAGQCSYYDVQINLVEA